jgi:serine/threonine-protein kinase
MTLGVTSDTSAPVRASAVPSDPVAAREFLQSRVSIYLGVALAIWGIAFLIDRVMTLVNLGDPFAENARWYVGAHLCAIGILALFYIATRRWRCPVPVLRAMDVVATLMQALFSTLLFTDLPLASRPEMLALLASTLFLMLRAGLVPSTTLVGFGMAVLAVSPANVLTYWLYTTHPMIPGLGMNLARALFYSIEWSAMVVVATTSIHRVIYGLQERVQELGQYTLLHKIGEGGMGVVYRARHALLRRATAVKVLPSSRTSPTGIARFEREVQLTAELAHPNIVSVYDFGRTPDGSFYYAMEFLDGVDLQRLVEDDGPMPPERVVHLLKQAADALAEAHDVGLIHRDVKPANLLVSNPARRPDHLTVLDFGLAKDVSDGDAQLSGMQEITGTPLYMSPESIMDPKEVDGRTDVYALGAVGYWLLTGTAPFAGRTIVEICAAHIHKEPDPPSLRVSHAIPADLERLIMQCLAKQKHERPDGARASCSRVCAQFTSPHGAWNKPSYFGNCERNARRSNDASRSNTRTRLRSRVGLRAKPAAIAKLPESRLSLFAT